MTDLEIAQLRADNERLREALVGLEKAGSEVSRREAGRAAWEDGQ